MFKDTIQPNNKSSEPFNFTYIQMEQVMKGKNSNNCIAIQYKKSFQYLIIVEAI